MEFVIRQFLGLFRRPKFRFGPTMDEARQRRLRVRNTEFLGFLEGSGFRRHQPDRYARVLHRRRFVAQALGLLLLIGVVWVMIESAQALALF